MISASIISIPCAVLISKLSLPETKIPQTMGSIPKELPAGESSENSFDKMTKKQPNVMVALMDGGAQGIKLAVGITTLLIVVLGLEEVVDLVLQYLPYITGEPISINRVLAFFIWPFTVLIGLRPEEWQLGAKILGTRFIETEVTAYFQLAALQSASPPAFSIRSFTAITYSLCGFVHIASIGIFVGGLAALISSRIREISIIGIHGLWTAFLATLLTGCIAGVLA